MHEAIVKLKRKIEVYPWTPDGTLGVGDVANEERAIELQLHRHKDRTQEEEKK